MLARTPATTASFSGTALNPLGIAAPGRVRHDTPPGEFGVGAYKPAIAAE